MSEATIDAQVENLRNWAVGNDVRRRDWPATWRTWVGKWNGQQAPDRPPNGRDGTLPPLWRAWGDLLASLPERQRMDLKYEMENARNPPGFVAEALAERGIRLEGEG